MKCLREMMYILELFIVWVAIVSPTEQTSSNTKNKAVISCTRNMNMKNSANESALEFLGMQEIYFNQSSLAREQTCSISSVRFWHLILHLMSTWTQCNLSQTKCSKSTTALKTYKNIEMVKIPSTWLNT